MRFVLQVDVSDTVLAQDPFQLFAAQSGQYDLWVNVQKNTAWVQQNYQVGSSRGLPALARWLGHERGPGLRSQCSGRGAARRGHQPMKEGERPQHLPPPPPPPQDCYGRRQPYVLGEAGLVYNAGVVGGKRQVGRWVC